MLCVFIMVKLRKRFKIKRQCYQEGLVQSKNRIRASPTNNPGAKKNLVLSILKFTFSIEYKSWRSMNYCNYYIISPQHWFPLPA